MSTTDEQTVTSVRLASVFSVVLLFLVLVSGPLHARPSSSGPTVPLFFAEIDLIDAQEFGELVVKMSIREQGVRGDQCTLAMYGDGRVWARILTKYGSACGLEVVVEIGPDSVLTSIPAIAIQTEDGERFPLSSYNTAFYVEGDFNEKIV